MEGPGNGSGKRRVNEMFQSSLPENPTEEETHRFMRGLEISLQQVRNDQNVQGMALQRIESLAKAIKEELGSEEEDGRGGFIGKGLKGRTRRLERRFSRLDDWRNYALGAVGAVSVILGALWAFTEAAVQRTVDGVVKAAASSAGKEK